MHGRSGIVVLLAVLVCGVAPALAHAQAPAAPPSATPLPRTEIYVFSPYSSQSLNKDLKVSRTIKASCDQASQVDVNRPDAWACTAAGKTYDPCFANEDLSELACPDLPGVSDGTLSAASVMSVVTVQPSTPIDGDQANTPGPDPTPFLVELVDGQFCVPEPRDIRFASLPIFGYCSGGYWFGPGDLSQPQWMLPILQSAQSVSLSQVRRIGVRRLWY